MKRLLAVMIFGLAVNGCMTASEPAVATEEQSVAASALQCFTCELDPSVRACASIASAARWRCERACVVCDDFGDGLETCFRGSCEPDF